MMPKQTEIEAPLLKWLEEMGGRARPSELYPLLARQFPQLTEADLAETLPTGGNRWRNRVRWVWQRLIEKGQLESPDRGVWAISERGRERLRAEGAAEPQAEARTPSIAPAAGPPANLEELAEDYLEAFKQKTLQKLQDFTPQQFERFAGALLAAYGFVGVQITGKTGEGGIDKFRGAIQGEFEQGIFFTTSDFSREAQQASIKKGATPIVLLNGEAIVELMAEKGLGVRRRPVELYEDQIESLFEAEE